MRKPAMPITGGISCPPSEEAVSIAAAVARGMPAPIIAGMVAEPTVMALAAPAAPTVPRAMGAKPRRWRRRVRRAHGDLFRAPEDRVDAAEGAQHREHEDERAD